MTLLQRLELLESGSRFKTLDYATQVDLRLKSMRIELKSNPILQKLDARAKQKVISTLAFRIPKFEDPAFQRYADDVLTKYKLGEEEGRKELVGRYWKNEFWQNWGIIQLINKGLMPVTDQLNPKGKSLRAYGGMASYEFFYGKDQRKFSAYLDYLIGKSEPRAKLKKNLAAIGGGLADWATFTAATMGASFGVGPLGRATIKAGEAAALVHGKRAAVRTVPTLIDKMYRSIAKGTTVNFAQSRLAQWGFRAGLPNVAQAIVEGGGDLLRDTIRVSLHNEIVQEKVERSLLDMAKIFGLGAMRDFGYATAGSIILPVIGLIPRVVKGYGDALDAIRKASTGDYQKIITRAAAGDWTPDRVLARFPEWVQDRVSTIRGIRKTASNIELMRPGSFPESQLNTYATGASAVRVEEGYRVRTFKDPNEVLRFGKLRELNDWLSERVGKMVKEEELSPSDYNSHLIANFETHKILNYALDPTATVEQAEKVIFKRKGAVKKGTFISPINRQYITPAEAEIATTRVNSKGALTYRVRAMFEGEEAGRFAKGEFVETNGKIWDTTVPADEADTYIFARRTATYQEYENVQKLAGETEGADVETLLARYGYDAAWVNPEGTKLLTLNRSGVKFISDKVHPKTGRWLGRIYTAADKTSSLGKASSELFVRQKLSATVPLERLAGDEELMSRLLASGLEGGRIDKKIVEDFARIYLAKFGLKPEDYGDLLFRETPSKAAVKAVSGEGRIMFGLPERLGSAGAERVFISSFVDQLENLGRTLQEGTVFSEAAAEASRRFLDRYGDVVKKGRIFSTMWGGEDAARRYLRYLGEKSGKFAALDWAEGKLNLYDSGGNIIRSFDNMEAAFDEVIPATMNRADVQRVVSWDRARLVKEGDLFRIYSYKEGKLLGEGATPGQALKASGLDYKLPPRHMPRIISIDESVAKIEFDGLETRVQNVNEMNRLLAQYDHGYTDAKLGFSGDVLKSYQSSAAYIVENTELGHWKKFKNIAEAQSYYADVATNANKLNEMAAEKGMKIRIRGSGYDVVMSGKYYHASNEDELKRLMQQSPLPMNGPELVDVNGELGDITSFLGKQESELTGMDIDFKAAFKPIDYMIVAEEEARAGLPVLMEMTHFFRPTDDVLPQMVRASGHKPILDLWRGMEDHLRIAEAETMKYIAMVKRALSVPGRGGKLKVMSNPRLEAITHYMRAKPEELAEVAVKFSITEAEAQAAKDIRKILGESPTEGLFSIFIDDPNKFLFDYVSRFRVKYEQAPRKVLSQYSDPIELAKKLMGSDYVPKEIVFSANEDRINDILTIAVDNNILSIMKKYISLGMKRTFIGPDWIKMGKYMGSNWHDIPGPLREAVTLYKQQILGIPPSFSKKQFKDMGSRIATSLKIDPKYISDVLSGYFSLNYMTNMGWRPWLCFRNMWQILTTLGPRFGNANVGKALKMATGKEGALIYEHLQTIGSVTGRIPVFAELSSEQGVLGKVVRKSLRMYKSSDDMTRVIAFATAKAQWDEAIGALNKGIIDVRNPNWGDQFLETAGVNLVEKDVYAQVQGFLQKKQFDAALDAYGTRVLKDTMFDYRPAMRPRLFSKTIGGQVFGQYGTYSVNYLANIMKGFRNGTRAQKIAFATRFLFNQAALFGAFASIGINAKNFIPGAPLMFNGGPIWHQLMTLAESMGPGYTGRQARGKLKRIIPFNLADAVAKGEAVQWDQFPYMIPGAMQYRDVRRALELIDGGQYGRAFAALMSAPAVPDSPEVWDYVMEMYPDTKFSQEIPTEREALRSTLRRR